MWTRALVVIVCSILITTLTPAFAITLDVFDNNSSIAVDTGSQDGLFSWNVDGVSQMSREWFWLRTGNDTQEVSLDTLTLNSSSAVGNQISVSYSGQDFDVAIDYTLLGGANGSGISRIEEEISFLNTGTSALNLSWFSFSDLDLDGTPLDQQAAGGSGGITQRDGLVIANVVNSLAANAFQIAVFDDLVDSFNDAALTNLDNSGSPSGPADLQFAFQHNFVIPVDGTTSFSQIKDVSAVPEPGSLSLLFAGVALLFIHRQLRQHGVY
jgi:PEP-CTERM motif-containing protein